MFILRLIVLEIFFVTIFIKISCSLRCRTENGPSDGELKRVARSCMRKFGDVAFAQSSQQHNQQQLQYYQHEERQQSQGRFGQRITNKNDYLYDDNEESDNDNFDEEQYRYNYNNRNNHRQQNGRNNNERGGIAGNNDRHNYQHNPTRNQNKTNTGNGNNNWNYSNQGNVMRSLGNNNNNNKNSNKYENNYNNQNNSFLDSACIVHCFFVEMHMLNNNDYPDRHKMLYILTKDIRDQELRNFYTDTIRECFRYLENQRRRDKCQFSRDLISCMTEYAKGSCDDWNEFNMMFN